MSQQLKLVVTGASGYIGFNLTRRLAVEMPHAQLIGIDRQSHPDAHYEEHVLDLSDCSVDAIANILSGAHTVFHLAAARADWGLGHDEYERDNVFATRNLVTAGVKSGVKNWLYFSTVGIYGPSNIPIDEDSPLTPLTDYGKTKAAAESLIVEVARLHNWALGVLRPSAVYSEDQPNNTNIHRLIEAIRRHRFVMIGHGNQIKTTSYLHNLLDATLWLQGRLEAPRVETYNYVDEPALTTRDLVSVIRKNLDVKLPLLRLPLFVVETPARLADSLANLLGRDLPITAARIRKFCTSTHYSASRIRQAGFVPRIDTVRALVSTVEAHKRVGH